MSGLIEPRRRAWLGLVVGALCVLGAAKAEADGYKSGNNLLADCDAIAPPGSMAGAYSQGVCMGYVIGIADAFERNAVAGWWACIPQASTQRQIKDVVMNWLRQHPEKRHFQASGLVAHALSEAFPCP